MNITKSEPQLSVAVSEGTVCTIQGLAAQSHLVVIENLDAANTLTYRFQYSNDGSSWTDVAADATLAPTLRVRATLTGSVFYRLRASGNLNIAVKVDAETSIVGNQFSMAQS
jgi:hypothetical protein